MPLHVRADLPENYAWRTARWPGEGTSGLFSVLLPRHRLSMRRLIIRNNNNSRFSGTAVRQSSRFEASNYSKRAALGRSTRLRRLGFSLSLSSMRSWASLLVILTVAAVVAASDQQVLQQHAVPRLESVQRTSARTNSTGNLIFWSVNSLLQHWPNTRYITGMETSRWTRRSVLIWD